MGHHDPRHSDLNRTMNRIVSLIASSTETVCALGFEEQLVGRSHECDYPPSVQKLPVCSEAKFDLEGSSIEIDERVREALEKGNGVYRTHGDVLRKLNPTVIVTQDHCEVCAVGLPEVEAVVSKELEDSPTVVSLAPSSLDSIFVGMVEIASALGDASKGKELVASIKRRMNQVAAVVSRSSKPKPRIACIEWVEPLMVAGNWMPELAEIAGAIDVLGPKTIHSAMIEYKQLVDADPDYVIVMLCGWGIEKTRKEMNPVLENGDWNDLRAFREGRVFYTDGNHYFNRPGPRLAESLEILAEIIRPESIHYGYEGTAWIRS